MDGDLNQDVQEEIRTDPIAAAETVPALDEAEAYVAKNLFPAHLAKLQSSGLKAPIIAKNEIKSSDNAAKIGNVLKWDGPATCLDGGMVFPYRTRSGERTGYYQIRPTKPRTVREKTIKYECPASLPVRIYIPFGVDDALNDPSVTLALTEGVLKALAGTQANMPTLGLIGIWGGFIPRPKDANGKSYGEWILAAELQDAEGLERLAKLKSLAGTDAAIDGVSLSGQELRTIKYLMGLEKFEDIQPVVWKGRTVLVIFDSDILSNPQVATAAFQLCKCLEAKGAIALVVILPVAADGSKQGLDDLIVNQGVEVFQKCVAEAKPAKKPPRTKKKNESYADNGPPPSNSVLVGPDEHRVTDECIRLLAGDPDLFQRGGVFVRTGEDKETRTPEWHKVKPQVFSQLRVGGEWLAAG